MTLNIKLKNVLYILLGSFIFSLGLVHFNIQNHLGEGGFTGITLLIYFLWGVNPALSNIILNIPMFIIGYKILGKNTFVYTLIGTLSVSVFLYFIQLSPIETLFQSDMILAALFGGVFLGVGLGIIFKYGGTTGGVDIIAKIVQKNFGWSIGKTMLIFDTVVITSSILTYLNHIEGMYTLILVFVTTRVLDFIQEGAYSTRGAVIISNKSQAITKALSNELERGITVFKRTGAYTNTEHSVIYIVISKSELRQFKSIINTIDPHAFVTITTNQEVLGEGFTLDENKKPIFD